MDSLGSTGERLHYFVSAGLLRPKKQDTRTNRLNRYLNYSLVGLASMAANSGSEVTVLHGGYMSPEAILESITVSKGDSLLLSLPSAYSLPWAADFLRGLRAVGYSGQVACGGRWVLNNRVPWVESALADSRVRLCAGPGEAYIRERFGPAASRGPHMDYTLMPDYEDYQPSIEVARGCGRGCAFCVERSEPSQVMSTGREAAGFLAHLEGLYGSLVCRPFMEASLFAPSEQWTREFCLEYERLGIRAKWRAESRVDSLNEATLRLLSRAGLGVLDLGLESASHSSLIAMGKTRNPEDYLCRADELLHVCSSLGIKVKLNLVLYAGDDTNNVNETLTWLRGRKGLFKGLSANPLIYYPSSLDAALPRQLARLGASYVDPDQICMSGYADLNLSPRLSNADARRICTEVSQEFMSAIDYYELKKFGYFSPSLSYDELRQAARQDDPAQLPFRLPDCDERS